MTKPDSRHCSYWQAGASNYGVELPRGTVHLPGLPWDETLRRIPTGEPTP